MGDRRLAFALLVGGAILLAGAFVWAPRPGAFDPEHPPRALAMRGPAVVEYDAANDTTHAVFLCGHWHCYTAVRIEGDAREDFASARVALAATKRDAGVVPIPPIEVGEPYQPVAVATDARFEVRPFWVAFALAPAGGLAIVSGVGARARGRDGATLAAGAALSGAIVGGWTATFPGDTIVWGYMLLLILVILAGLTLTIGKGWKKRWSAAAFAVATVAMFVWARPWFPSAPSL